jgi:hypothetical protein
MKKGFLLEKLFWRIIILNIVNIHFCRKKERNQNEKKYLNASPCRGNSSSYGERSASYGKGEK